MGRYEDYTRVTELKHLPEGEHYVILEFDTYHYSTGYEKEGEFGSSASKVNYLAYKSRELWEAEIKQRSQPVPQSGYGYRSSTPWVAVVVRRPKVTVNVNVDVGIGE